MFFLGLCERAWNQARYFADFQPKTRCVVFVAFFRVTQNVLVKISVNECIFIKHLHLGNIYMFLCLAINKNRNFPQLYLGIDSSTKPHLQVMILPHLILWFQVHSNSNLWMWFPSGHMERIIRKNCGFLIGTQEKINILIGALHF